MFVWLFISEDFKFSTDGLPMGESPRKLIFPTGGHRWSTYSRWWCYYFYSGRHYGLVYSKRFCRSVEAPGLVFWFVIGVFSYISPVLGFSNLNISFWNSTRRFLISEVISSFKETLKRSKKLFSTLGDFSCEGPAMLAS